MKKEKHSGDKLSEQTLHEILLDIKYRLNHIEDISADNRAIIVKLVKQSNQVVEFLKDMVIEEVTDDYYDNMKVPDISIDKTMLNEKSKKLKELLDEFLDKREDLKELEKELKKHKNDITPGQIGEA